MSENYVPLYRKYRPQTLDMLVGQEHIKKTLTSAIELGKIAHAFLFTGPRGTGKTSTARILAKSLNCKNGPTIHPCGECESCKDIMNTVPIDVIEIDAASNRKVEDTQSILEKIQYVPVHGKYKIYIIDEVHMLTNHAFNALLKTLEEPPENVIFILATTEVHKVLDTIKSRCQRFDFRRITTEDIVKHLRYISDKENINISDDALFTIAKNS
ncbi:DNA polymerase III subunit gamma/tau, partial [bacterium]|nr:DNA polymerase III subunit gamma/tau [bacterium]